MSNESRGAATRSAPRRPREAGVECAREVHFFRSRLFLVVPCTANFFRSPSPCGLFLIVLLCS